MIDDSSELRDLAAPTPPAGPLARLGQAVRSLAFLLFYFGYMTLVLGLGQRLLVWPLITLLPGRRRAIVRAWLQGNAKATLALARSLAGLRLEIEGRIPAESCIAVMNHQSVLDIPLGIMMIRGPYPIIPTRDRYRRGVPGISALARLARFPFVSQGRTASRAELVALKDVAEQVARGEQSLLIFPEGHRTRGGSIGPFMKSGLRLVLSRASRAKTASGPRPVYCIVADGMWHARTFGDVAFRFAGTAVRVKVLGPFATPADSELDAFIDTLHDHMAAALAELRGLDPAPPARLDANAAD